MSHHGVSTLRGIEHVPCSPFQLKERFGRLFPSLPGLQVPEQKLLDLAASMEEPKDRKAGDSPTVTAGFTFFGQFVDHDMTLDTTSSLERQNDPAAIRNFRTPLLELDSVYGSGPDASPHLYDRTKPGRFFTGNNSGNPRDLPRNRQGAALIGDPRNDENGIISQLQLAFLRFHNAVYALVAGGKKLRCRRYYDDPFREAQRLVRWHYQWIVVHEFLPLIVDGAVLRSVLGDGFRCYDWDLEPFMPVEFSVAAYRFGHSQIRSRYTINAKRKLVQLFKPPADALTAFEPVPKENVIDWAHFFKIPGSTVKPAPSRKIDTLITSEVFNLPFITSPPKSLPARNLLRGQSFSLPSGELVACALGVEPLTPKQLGTAKLDLPGTPLWFYILKEAELHPQNKLGEVGGRIVAEVLAGILHGDANSYLNMAACWKPCLPAKKAGEFTMADLVTLAATAT